jgi:hypothetical protein
VVQARQRVISPFDLTRGIVFLLIAACGQAASRSDAGGETCEPGAADCAAAPIPSGEASPDVTAADSAPVPSGSSAVENPPLSAQPELEPRCFSYGSIDDQAALDALEGCDVIEADLSIAFPTADLRPLHALRRVGGNLLLTGRPASGGEPGMESLEGLEQLEEVGGTLMLETLAAPTLAPLANLRRVGRVVDAGFIQGELYVRNMPNLRNLEGLQNLEFERTVLGVGGNVNLESLEPLVFPRDMGPGRLLVQQNPKLSNLGDFGSVESLEYLELQGTALTNLDALSSLRRVLVLQVWSNPELIDASGLARLESTHLFTFGETARVETLPDFEQMVGAGLVSISSNAALVELPAFPRLGQLAGDWSGQLIVEDNPSLVELGGFQVLESADAVSIRRNASLTRVDLPALRDVRQGLVITSNPALDAASLSPLATVTTPFAKIAGNGPDAELLDPCPWPTDGECDTAPASGLCAAGTDAEDCSLLP